MVLCLVRYEIAPLRDRLETKTHARENDRCDSWLKGGETMLGWAVTFLIIALIAAVFGFGGIAAASAGIAKLLFFVFLVTCVIFFIFRWRGRRVS
jgi:uncharacterized membrane protein YtjA (UPF0391 family)